MCYFLYITGKARRVLPASSLRDRGSLFFFLSSFGRAPVTLRHTKDFCLCHHYFCPPPQLPALKDHSSYLSCSKLTRGINIFRHEPFPGKDIMNTVQGWECSLSQASGQLSQSLAPLATDRQAAHLKTQCNSCMQPGCEKKSNLVEKEEEIRVIK